jgi:DNA-binding NarL/FixJ family response regulator
MRAVRAGAADYLLKEDDPRRLLEAVRAVLAGETPLDQGLAMWLLRRLGEEVDARSPNRSSEPQASPEQSVVSLAKPLTPRETEVLGRLAAEETNRQIAQGLHLSLSTVKRHLEHILAKLGVSDRTQAAVKAIELGLRPPT